MGRIVSGGVRRHVTEPTNGADSRKWFRKQVAIGGRNSKALRFSVYGKRIAQLEQDRDAIVAHFGVNKTDAVMIALHIVAQGIKEGRFNA